ncbi:MAG: MMPL family transporter [Bacteroidales bacterium]|nr:MMPL family transporter [Bacteroidales bacterium]
MTGFIIKYRWWIIGICLALGAGFGVLIPFSGTDPDIRNYVPSSMHSRHETDKIEKDFGVQDMVVILFSDSSVLAGDILLRIKEIDKVISRFNGVSDRLSPFTVSTIKGEEGMITAGKLIKNIPSDSEGIASLSADILRNRFARDIVISSDMTTASITATISTKIPEAVTLQRIDSAIIANPGRSVVLTGGLPYIRRSVLKDVRTDGLILVPAALLIMLIMLKLTLGDWRSVLMPFTVVLLSTVISLGFIPLLGWKISVLTLLVPIILVGVANNYGIYLVARYQELSVKKPDLSKQEMLGELLNSLNMPILFSGLTTIAGILGLLTHSVNPARQVGILAATGVSAALVMSLFLIPSLRCLRKSRTSTGHKERVKGKLLNLLLSHLSSLIVNHRGKILIISAAMTLLISSGSLFVKIDTNQENYFPPGHQVRQSSEMINKKFGGSQAISVMINGDIKSPEVMHGIDRITDQVENMKGVGRVFAISQVVKEMSKAIYSINEEGYDKIPASGEAIAQMFELYNMSGNREDFSQIMNLDNTKAHILIRLSDPSNEVVKKVTDRISLLAAGIPAEVTIGGYAVIMADFAGSVIRGQISSLVFALITVFILLAIIFRSIRGGLIGCIPLAVSIMILFGIMGFAGIALDAATALLSSIMIGVGVDFTIQYVWCYNSQIRKRIEPSVATVETIATIGRSIIINAVSVMVGFSVLMFSGFTSIRFFGYLVLISIGSCLIGAVIVIPAFLLHFKPAFVEREFRRDILKEEKLTQRTHTRHKGSQGSLSEITP